VRLFLDSSVVLAACGRPTGASRYLFDIAPRMGWSLLTSTYVRTEVERNLSLRLPAAAELAWRQLSPMLQGVADVVTFNWPTLVGVGKDRPVLFTAAAFSDALLTLDRADFGALMATGFYGLQVLTPGEFLRRERAAGRLPTL
jgi:predicted nucleic acid-binding protein